MQHDIFMDNYSELYDQVFELYSCKHITLVPLDCMSVYIYGIITRSVTFVMIRKR